MTIKRLTVMFKSGNELTLTSTNKRSLHKILKDVQTHKIANFPNSGIITGDNYFFSINEVEAITIENVEEKEDSEPWRASLYTKEDEEEDAE